LAARQEVRLGQVGFPEMYGLANHVVQNMPCGGFLKIALAKIEAFTAK